MQTLGEKKKKKYIVDGKTDIITAHSLFIYQVMGFYILFRWADAFHLKFRRNSFKV